MFIMKAARNEVPRGDAMGSSVSSVAMPSDFRGVSALDLLRQRSNVECIISLCPDLDTIMGCRYPPLLACLPASLTVGQQGRMPDRADHGAVRPARRRQDPAMVVGRPRSVPSAPCLTIAMQSMELACTVQIPKDLHGVEGEAVYIGKLARLPLSRGQ